MYSNFRLYVDSAYRLFGTKTLRKTMLAYCNAGLLPIAPYSNKLQWNSSQEHDNLLSRKSIWKFHLHNCRSSRLGLNVLNPFRSIPSESLPLLKTSSAKWQPSSSNVLTTPLYSTEMFLSVLPLPQWMGREFWDNWNIMGKWHQSEWRPIIIISIHSCHQGAARETIRPHTQGRGWWKGSATNPQKTTTAVWDLGCSTLLLWWHRHQSKRAEHSANSFTVSSPNGVWFVSGLWKPWRFPSATWSHNAL